ncbi:MAG: alpha/beta hydrolase [Verrucomicrobiales bacterium]|nr:alpha/beta hydrolase [Verrucomicrobiales bacterium]
MSLVRLAPLVPFEEAVAEIPPENFVEIDGQRVFAHDIGSGPPIILLHGFASTSHSFRELFGDLASEYRLIGIDLNGFGNTERPKNPKAYRIEEQASVIAKVLEKKGIDRAVVLGHSYGAAVSAVLSAKIPEVVSRVILICPPSEFAEKPPWYLRNAIGMHSAYFMIRALLTNGDKFKKVSGQAVYVDGVLTDELAELYRKSMLVEGLKEACFGYGKTFATGTTDWIRYGGIVQPALVIAGDQDQVVSVDGCRKVAEKIPSSKLMVISECGHCPPEERPQEVLASLRKFLAGGID